MRLATTIITAVVLAPTVVGQETSYPRGHLLNEPSRLAETISEERFTILDTRPREEYEQAHVPGAYWIDVSEWKNEFGTGADASGWSERIGRLGITPDTTVVVYDDNSAKDAARVWWILRFWGVEDARLLNGGWTGWRAADGPTQMEAPDAPRAVEFQVQPSGQRLATKQSLLEAIANQSVQIVDARSESEFCGIDRRDNARAGAIPGAKHLEWSDLVDAETQRFKPASELRKQFEEAGVDLDEPVAAHCQSGGRSSVMSFAMELMGAARVRNYYAGWSEWGNAENTPVVKPERPQP